MPQDFAIPSLYFPPTETLPALSSLNSYQSEYTIYAKVFALTKREAGKLAEKIVQGIMLKKCTVPVYLENGKDSGKSLRLEPPESRVTDEGTAQVTLRYRIIRTYTTEHHTGVSAVGINKKYD
jgi:hypothetical protein